MDDNDQHNLKFLCEEKIPRPSTIEQGEGLCRIQACQLSEHDVRWEAAARKGRPRVFAMSRRKCEGLLSLLLQQNGNRGKVPKCLGN